ncbi:MAG TPA: hypothetical protein VHZ95_14420, partial [Polyangiales bacterium]|nr:hypothetical protein [Polyangiales bacterium]
MLASLACVLACLAFVNVAFARPGGGQTFSSHSYSSHSGGSYGGGGGGGELIFRLIRLMFFYPWISLPLVALFAIYWMRAKRSMPESWDSNQADAPAAVSGGGGIDLASLRALDPEFSRVVFEDFAYRLYASAERARHDPNALAALAPYLSERVRAELSAEPPASIPVSNVVVGALRIVDSSFRDASADQPATVQLALDYISNLTLGSRAQSQTFYLHEVWSLERDASARTKPPEETERLGCPNCGAPFESSDGRRCNYCGQVAADGRFAWQVVSREVLERESSPPALTSDVEERGTDFPSVVDRDDEAAWQTLRARDPAVDDASLQARIACIYDVLNRGWTALDLSPVRGFVSDAMFDYLHCWTEAYAAQGLRNRL